MRTKIILFLAGTSIGAMVATTTPAADGAAFFDQQCAHCHGKAGASTDTNIPIIGGYSTTYILGSFKNFKTKERVCAEVTIPSGPKKGQKSDMCKVTADLSAADADAVAKYLSGQKFVRAKQSVDASLAEKGSSVYKLRCEKCHEQNGSSPDEDNGILAGQWSPYLRAQIAAFRTGKRPIDEKMKQRLDKVSKDEEEMLVQFFASQQ
jgi:sulfide dehydrogenase cytochrome subunit